MTTARQIEALVSAHYLGDQDRFRITVLQIAAGLKGSESTKKALASWANREQVLVPLGAKDFVTPLPHVDFEQLILGGPLRSALLELVAEYRCRAGFRAVGLPVRQRLLFHGPSGCGKTATAAALAPLFRLVGYEAQLTALVDSHMGATSAQLAKLFPVLSAGALLVVHEIDSIGSERGGIVDSANKERNSIVNTLLTLLDGTEGGMFIATTNRPDMLDPAFRQRFDAELAFPEPGEASTEQLIALLAARYGLAGSVCLGPEERTSYRSITKAVERAARAALLPKLFAELPP